MIECHKQLGRYGRVPGDANITIPNGLLPIRELKDATFQFEVEYADDTIVLCRGKDVRQHLALVPRKRGDYACAVGLAC